ncbi:hypothetical protein FKW77_006157 [Venturia effusa]|uniref:Ubiquitin 3 binding protein But2 C-terminal domain-containing protein n=1 Tax=Venturia effusa TaxID=50376 RepID=A0A517LP66_9PEZI|nr:hypothetical protein FKW77_006157 [Venturia effusa]
MKYSFLATFLLLFTAAQGQRAISADGKCGMTGGGTTCFGSKFGDCCGSTGECDKRNCGNGCQPDFGKCQSSNPGISASQSFFPSLIIPIQSDQPTRAFGTQKSGAIKWDQGNEIATEIAFDNLPFGGERCSLNFVLARNGPWTFDAQSTKPWTFGIYNMIGGLVSQEDTWNKHPLATDFVANVILSVGPNAQMDVAISNHTVPCTKGRAQFLLRSYPSSFNLTWFEIKEVPPTEGRNGITFDITFPQGTSPAPRQV